MPRIIHPRPLPGRQTAFQVEFRDGVAQVADLHPERALALTQHGFAIETPDDEAAFLDLTVKELRELAKIEGLELPRGANKAEIVATFVRAGMEAD